MVGGRAMCTLLAGHFVLVPGALCEVCRSCLEKSCASASEARHTSFWNGISRTLGLGTPATGVLCQNMDPFHAVNLVSAYVPACNI